VPVALVDFTSMYPSVNALLATWKLLCAERLEPTDVTDEVRELLTDPQLLDHRMTPELWLQLGVTLVELRPAGDVLPVRGRHDPVGDNYGIGVNPLSYDGTLWYMLPDVVAAATRSPPTPTTTAPPSSGSRPTGTSSPSTNTTPNPRASTPTATPAAAAHHQAYSPGAQSRCSPSA
jgi:hypothetical protein